MSKLFLILGSINAATAVSMGAFGAHFLKTKIPEDMLSVFQTAVQYHFYHSHSVFRKPLSFRHNYHAMGRHNHSFWRNNIHCILGIYRNYCLEMVIN
jgi:uncharacterized membrane protein YgdD (TMEM256/DUF423 family)